MMNSEAAINFAIADNLREMPRDSFDFMKTVHCEQNNEVCDVDYVTNNVRDGNCNKHGTYSV